MYKYEFMAPENQANFIVRDTETPAWADQYWQHCSDMLLLFLSLSLQFRQLQLGWKWLLPEYYKAAAVQLHKKTRLCRGKEVRRRRGAEEENPNRWRSRRDQRAPWRYSALENQSIHSHQRCQHKPIMSATFLLLRGQQTHQRGDIWRGSLFSPSCLGVFFLFCLLRFCLPSLMNNGRRATRRRALYPK